MSRVYEAAAQMLRMAMFVGVVLGIVWAFPALEWLVGAGR